MKKQQENDGAVGFAQVLSAELNEIGDSRTARKLDVAAQVDRQTLEEVYQAAHDKGLLGLSFSGGGIRSATVNLGVLQALAKRGMLPYVDYLSTVSGGGYLGSWLVSWIQRTDGNKEGTALATVQEQLSRQAFSRKDKEDQKDISRLVLGREPKSITHLRQYSNYLTPRLGVFNADFWSMAAIWGRNTMLNLLILIAAFASLLLIPRLFGFLFTKPWSKGPNWFGVWPFAPWLMGLCLAVPVLLIGCNLLAITCSGFAAKHRKTRRWCQSGWTLHFLILAPTLAAAVFIGQWLCNNSGKWQADGLIHSILWPMFGLSVLFLVKQSVAGFAQCFTNQHKKRHWFWFAFLYAGVPVVCGFITAALLYGLVVLGKVWMQPGESPWRALVWVLRR